MKNGLIFSTGVAVIGLVLFLIGGIIGNDDLADTGKIIFYVGILGLMLVMFIATFSTLWPLIE